MNENLIARDPERVKPAHSTLKLCKFIIKRRTCHSDAGSVKPVVNILNDSIFVYCHEETNSQFLRAGNLIIVATS